ncbi:MAG TPA: hypothetical protein VJU15_13960 [Gemmatimonadales bacterium]|nr:hypothetical protein [Gemmatimonadales bacterium]
MRIALALLLLTAYGSRLPAQVTQPLDSALLAGLKWRSIGPANMSGRVSDIEGLPSPSRTFYVATAAGGLWKTTNAGTTFDLVFGMDQPVISMGDVAIAPSDSNTLYLGTGEEDSRNSISPGGGMFKSTDGGKTWEFIGLKETETIGRIIVHPTDPNTVWVAALGTIWRSNPERGIYKTTDGGKTWRLVKFVSDKAGFVDLAIDPSNPNVLWASSWERVRGPYYLRSGGPGSGLWKSTDGGESWTQVKGNGLPESTLGRISIGLARSNPRIMYLLVEADTMPNPKPTAGAKAQVRPSGLYKSEDGGGTWNKMQPQNVRPFYYSQVRVDPKNPDRVWWSSTPVNLSTDGGKTAKTATQGLHVDHHAMWIDPNDPNYLVVGNDGGIAVSFDGGGNYIFPNAIAIGQFYNVSYDMAVPYNVCGGLQDNGSWCGPSRRRGPITNVHWYNVGGGDGFHTAQDPTDPNIIYSESQGGNIGRLDYRTGSRVALVKPAWRPTYLRWQDSIIAIRPDTTLPETKEQKARIAEFRRRATQDSSDLALRWNWNTPFLLSPHDPNTLYMGANRVMKSVKRGDGMFAISPDLTMRDTMKIRVSTRATGGITPDNTGAETFATIVSLAESPIRPGLLYAGTDDGKLWLTRNDGGMWEDLTSRIPGIPPGTYVSRIEPSSHDSATFYVTFDNHRNGDFAPYAIVSEDFGRTFRSIAGGLPRGGINFVHVIREDPVNKNLLFAGTDLGAWVSTDRGGTWQRFMTGMPTVPVHDLKIHPREKELIAGTHGRSIWIVDIAPLEELTGDIMAAGAYLFKPRTAYRLNQAPDDQMGGGADQGHMRFSTNSPLQGAEFIYRVGPGQPSGRAQIAILDPAGDTVQTLTGSGSAGLQRVYWNLLGRRPPRPPLTPAGRRDSITLSARIDRVIDSLFAAGGVERPALDSAKTTIMSGGFAGFGGGGGGGGGSEPGVPAYRARPGEGPTVSTGPQGGGAAARSGGGGGGGGSAAGQIAQGLGGFQAMQALMPTPSPQPNAEPGDYVVVVSVAGKVMKQKFRVVNPRATGGLVGTQE